MHNPLLRPRRSMPANAELVGGRQCCWRRPCSWDLWKAMCLNIVQQFSLKSLEKAKFCVIRLCQRFYFRTSSTSNDKLSEQVYKHASMRANKPTCFWNAVKNMKNRWSPSEIRKVDTMQRNTGQGRSLTSLLTPRFSQQVLRWVLARSLHCGCSLWNNSVLCLQWPSPFLTMTLLPQKEILLFVTLWQIPSPSTCVMVVWCIF